MADRKTGDEPPKDKANDDLDDEGKGGYKFGDFTRLIGRKVTGDEDYKFGDISKGRVHPHEKEHEEGKPHEEHEEGKPHEEHEEREPHASDTPVELTTSSQSQLVDQVKLQQTLAGEGQQKELLNDSSWEKEKQELRCKVAVAKGKEERKIRSHQRCKMAVTIFFLLTIAIALVGVVVLSTENDTDTPGSVTQRAALPTVKKSAVPATSAVSNMTAEEDMRAAVNKSAPVAVPLIPTASNQTELETITQRAAPTVKKSAPAAVSNQKKTALTPKHMTELRSIGLILLEML